MRHGEVGRIIPPDPPTIDPAQTTRYLSGTDLKLI